MAASLHERLLRKAADTVWNEKSRKAVSRLQRLATPVGPGSLRRALDEVIKDRPPLMLMHSSLANCGQFKGGPDGAFDVLADYCETLFQVTHTYCYPKSEGEPAPVFDRAVTPSRNGLMSEVFRRRPGVARSIHSTHSLAASGPRADAYLAGHYLNDSPAGPGTPYSRLIHAGASALMFGVDFYSYTFFHTAEFESGSDHAYQHGIEDRLRVVDEEGQIRERPSRRQNWAPYRFREAGRLMEDKGLVRRARFGRSALLFVPDTAKIHDFMLERLRKMPDFLRLTCTVDLH